MWGTDLAAQTSAAVSTANTKCHPIHLRNWKASFAIPRPPSPVPHLPTTLSSARRYLSQHD